MTDLDVERKGKRQQFEPSKTSPCLQRGNNKENNVRGAHTSIRSAGGTGETAQCAAAPPASRTAGRAAVRHCVKMDPAIEAVVAGCAAVAAIAKVLGAFAVAAIISAVIAVEVAPVVKLANTIQASGSFLDAENIGGEESVGADIDRNPPGL